MLGRVFKAYDIRGTYPDLLNDQMAWQIGFGAGRFLLEDAAAAGETTPMMKNVVVGRDMRTSSPKLVEELTHGLKGSGAAVIDVGLVDTSFLYFAINYLDCAGGIMVTASHNPPQYNGFKISKRNAKPVGEETGLAEVRKYAAMVDRGQAGTRVEGKVDHRDLWDAYRKHVLSFCNIGGRELSVVVDASNGMAGTMCPKVFGRNGANVEGLSIKEINYDNAKGEFVHEPNPLVTSNLDQVRGAVTEHKADLGVCYDGDADRCVFIDERGEIVACDHLTAVLTAHFLRKHTGKAVVYDLRSTKAVEEEIKAAGGRPIRSRVGHVFMKQAMAEQDGIFGGELSGHFYFRDNFNADSGAIAMATVLTVLAKSGKKMSTLIAPAQRYIQSGEINFENEEKDAALSQVRDTFLGRGTIDDLDGVTVDCFESEGWWVNIRKSNTEPFLRLNAEARDRETLHEALGLLKPMLGVQVDH